MAYQHTAIQILSDNLCHIFHNSEYAIVFDPAEPNVILTALEKKLTQSFYHKNEVPLLHNTKPRKLLYTFVTHHHIDHSGGNELLVSHCEVVVHTLSNFLPHTQFLANSYNIKEMGLMIDVLQTPCHTQDSVCFYIDKKYLLTGDTIFHLGVGKFFEGTGKQMCDGIKQLKLNVCPDVLVLYGHDYRSTNFRFAMMKMKLSEELKAKMFLTFGEECMYNPFFQCKDNVEMERLRAEKNNFK